MYGPFVVVGGCRGKGRLCHNQRTMFSPADFWRYCAVGLQVPSSMVIHPWSLFLDSATIAHVIDRDLDLSRYTTGETRCTMAIKRSCGKRHTEREGRLDFTVEDTKGKQEREYSELLIVPKLGNDLFLVVVRQGKRDQSHYSRSPRVFRSGTSQ